MKTLTARENFMETLQGGNPDRFVNQYEYLALIPNPTLSVPKLPAKPGDPDAPDTWGVWQRWEVGQPGLFPVHDEEHLVIRDVTKWKDTVKGPQTIFTEEEWAPFVAMADAVDREKQFCAAMVLPGIFERAHHLMKIDEALVNLYEEPEAMEEILGYILDYEMKIAEEVCKYLKPDALFHHDDWGSQLSTFMSVDMFDEFILPLYKKLYSFYKDNGVEIIVHHSDSYCATIVPEMIDMGIDVWQGCVLSNDIPVLIEQYGGQIAFMGGIENGRVDRADWSPESVMAEVEDVCETMGKKYFIPCLCAGSSESTFDGVYDEISKCIDIMSERMF